MWTIVQAIEKQQLTTICLEIRKILQFLQLSSGISMTIITIISIIVIIIAIVVIVIKAVFFQWIQNKK